MLIVVLPTLSLTIDLVKGPLSLLQLLSIQDAAVCNCHSDNQLADMLSLVEAGYSCAQEEERMRFGMRLRRALHDFTTSFLPHMREEEEVTTYCSASEY